MYIIKDGSVHITKNIDGRPRLLARLSVGDFFGEICLFDIGLRTATAKTIQPCTLLEIHKAQFDALIDQHPAIGVKTLYAMMAEMGRRLRNTDEMMKNLVLWVMSTKEWEKLP
jgi:CRP/FNR family cyclic AMP-dependent transcriptional regulator